MILERIRKTELYLRNFVQQRFGIKLVRLNVETPPRVEFGDLAFPFPFELAKKLRCPPRQIAAEVVENIDTPSYIERLTVGGHGYVNLFFKRTLLFQELFNWVQQPFPEPQGDKLIVEHTNINPNKAAHIGHLRNATLGDTLVRALRARGRKVEVQNYIDNTGVQVADVVVGFQHLRQLSLEQVKSIEEPFDYYCWNLYAKVSKWYQQDKSNLEYRAETLKAIENNQESVARLADHVSMRIVLCHLKTMLRLGVQYQVLPRESEILHLKFWEDTFQLLKKKRVLVYREDGPNKGCWVMPLSKENNHADGEKIVVRSNNTVTYVGKDIAYQLWKFGLLEKNFHFHPFCQYKKKIVSLTKKASNVGTVWSTTTEKSPYKKSPFGQGSVVYNVIDIRQSYLQQVVVQGLERLGFKEQASRSIHFSYEMVALSPACCRELGIELSEEDKNKAYVEVSGRKGLGVKADDLIDKLIEKSIKEVATRQKDLSPQIRKKISTQIAIGALRYFLLKYTRNSVISFDFKEALSFEGETGPYLQYSVVRANNIFRKLSLNPEWSNSSWKISLQNIWTDPYVVSNLIEDNEIWELLLQVARCDEAIEQAIASLEMSTLAKHAFNLAQQFNLFYHKHHILSEKDPVKKEFYLAVTDIVRRGLSKILYLLGIEVPDRM